MTLIFFQTMDSHNEEHVELDSLQDQRGKSMFIIEYKI